MHAHWRDGEPVEADIVPSPAAMLSSRDDMHHARSCFDARGMVVLSNFLAPPFADAVLDDLEGLNSTGAWERREMGDPSDPTGFAFRFDKCFLTCDVPGPALHALRDLIRSDAMSNLVQRLTGFTPSPDNTVAFASRYRSGDFLSTHDDSDPDRFCAFVLTFTRHWRPHWGGHFMLLDERNTLAETVLPAFNQLVLFKVPQRHVVTGVMTPCPAARYACAGWFG
jgi:hypothetical protein